MLDTIDSPQSFAGRRVDLCRVAYHVVGSKLFLTYFLRGKKKTVQLTKPVL